MACIWHGSLSKAPMRVSFWRWFMHNSDIGILDNYFALVCVLVLARASFLKLCTWQSKRLLPNTMIRCLYIYKVRWCIEPSGDFWQVQPRETRVRGAQGKHSRAQLVTLTRSKMELSSQGSIIFFRGAGEALPMKEGMQGRDMVTAAQMVGSSFHFEPALFSQ